MIPEKLKKNIITGKRKERVIIVTDEILNDKQEELCRTSRWDFSDFTNRNTTFMTWNLLHLARMLKDTGGIPAHGNQRTKWAAGCRFDHPNPEYR